MDVAARVRDRLLAIDPLRALVSTRVYVQHLPQSPTYPSVVVQRVQEIQQAHLRGAERMRRTRVQVTSIGLSQASATQVDEAVQGDGDGSGLSHWTGSQGSPSVEIRWCEPAGVQEFYDPGELRQYRINRDYWIHHR